MLQFKSNEEILRFALAKEASSCQFYRDLSAMVTSPVSQGVFTALAKEEARHIESIQLELFKLGYTVKPEPPDAAEGDPASRLSLDEAARQMSFLEAISLAIEKERAAFRLFAELMTLTEESEARRILAELAEEEVRHLIRLETEYEEFTSSRKPSTD